MGLNISPPIWQSYINAILNCLQSRKYCEAIMDDLLLFTLTKSSHFEKPEDLLKALCKNGLKISPKQCQLFKTDLQNMGSTIFIGNKRVCVRPLRSQMEAIQKLKPPTMIKGCHKLCGYGKFCQFILPQTSKTFEAHILILLEKEDSFFGRKSSNKPLMRSKVDYKDPQSYIYPTDMDNSNCIPTPVNSPLVVCYTKFKMDNQSS